MKTALRNQYGFTLVEILTVIVIMGMLFATIFPRLNFASEKARMTGAQVDMKSFQTSAESYLRETVGQTTTETGLNTYLDKSRQFLSGVSNVKDPWKQPYRMQINASSASGTQIVFRSSGRDGISSSYTNLFQIGSSTSGDNDDIILVSQYKNGAITSCTSGLNTNIGSVNISSQSLVGTVNYTVVSNLANPFISAHRYAYALDIKAGWATYRSYLGANTPLDIQHTVPNADGTWNFYDITNTPFDLLPLFASDYDSYNGWWETIFFDGVQTGNVVESDGLTNYTIYQYMGNFPVFVRIQQVTSGSQINGCN